MQPSLVESIIQQVQQLTADEQLRLAKHIEWLATHPKPTNKVGSRLEDVMQYRQDIVGIAEKHGAKNVRIIGSIARNEARIDSDIDFLVDIGEKTSPWFPVGLIRDLSALLGRRVDIVITGTVPTELRQKILQDAVSL
ncbi:MAG: nucleotidyltransferase domain-containing protein [Cyanobacteria bacterium J06626_23]